MNLNDADIYLNRHKNSDAWNKLSEDEKLNSLQMAELYIDSALDLRGGTKDKPIYKHAIYEQAIHLIVFDNERFQLQQQGVTSYKFDDMNFNMDQSIISPITRTFLKKFTYKQLGEII